jgi:outer membrane protein assembly factor BamD
MQRRYQLFVTTVGLLAFFVLSGFGLPFRHKKYETPITKETLQPDKVLFDRAIKNIEHGDYEAARLTLNTLINTYDTSEYLAKAQLAIADSWFREGGAHGLAQAEQGYKDFILFFPNMEEAAESQFKICNIHYKQMEKADRDSAQAQRAEDECRDGIQKFPNSKFVPQMEQMLRNTQEVIADKEYRTGDFYHHRGSFPAAAARLDLVTKQYPLYSGSDHALWLLADAYGHMGDRFKNQEADALAKLVREYPLSDHVDNAKKLLTQMERPVPEADPVAYAHWKYELENRSKPGIVHRTLAPFVSHPETYLAAKSGTPAMEAIRPSAPVSVPAPAAGPTGISDVTAGVVGDSKAIDEQPEARLGQQQSAAGATSNGTGEQRASLGSNGQPAADAAKPVTNQPAADANQPLPTNHPPTKQQLKAFKKAQEKALAAQAKAKKNANAAKPTATPANSATPTAATSATTPAASTPAQ